MLYIKQKQALLALTGVNTIPPEGVQRLLALVPPLPLSSAPLPPPFLSPPQLQQLPGGTPALGTGDDSNTDDAMQLTDDDDNDDNGSGDEVLQHG